MLERIQGQGDAAPRRVLLVQRGPEGLAAGEIAAKLDLPASSLSFHLAHLNRAGMISQRRESRSLIYAADFSRMRALLDFLTEKCCTGASCVAAEDAPKLKRRAKA